MRRQWIVSGLAATLMLTIGIHAAELDIAEIDKNFRPATVDGLQVNYLNALEAPFEVTGFAWRKPGETLYRIPRTLTTNEVSGGVISLANHTSGGAIRFRTDSPYMTLRATIHYGSDMNHMPRSGSGGFDLYLDAGSGKDRYVNTLQPGPTNIQGELFERKLLTGTNNTMREWTLYLPLYSGVKSLEIGVAPGSKVLPPLPQKVTKPILFYGSSITQGGCASRPANNYTTMLCRTVDAPQINLGFSGNARGEIAMAKAIAELDLAAFIYDYDYNTPSTEHLQKTHEPFFQEIRKAHPDLPIIMLSKCSWVNPERRDIIRKTYQNAIAKGDKKVWFIDGAELFGEAGALNATVDNCHPNDLGFYEMYKRILPVLKEALSQK